MTCKASAKKISHFAHGLATGVADVDGAIRKAPAVSYTHTPDAAANTATTACADYCPTARELISGAILPGGAVTADDTDYATITVGYDDGAGGGVTSLAAVTTKNTGGTGNWTAGVAIALTAITPALSIPAGKYLSVVIAKAGAGVALPAFRVVLPNLIA